MADTQKPELLIAPDRAAKPPKPVKRRPIIVPDAAGLAEIIARACRHAPRPELLEGPTGLRGVLETWATAFEIRRPPQPRNPATAVLKRCALGLRTVLTNAHEPHPTWTAIVEQRIQTIEGWLREWPTGEPAAPPPRWHEAAQALTRATVRAFVEEAERTAAERGEPFDETKADWPSNRDLAATLKELLSILRVNVSLATARSVVDVH